MSVLEHLWSVNSALQSDATSTGAGTEADLGGKFGTAICQVSGSMGVITFKGTVDETNWVNLACVSLANGAATATAAATGLYSVPVLGLEKFAAHVTTASTAGPVSVTANFVPSVHNIVATT